LITRIRITVNLLSNNAASETLNSYMMNRRIVRIKHVDSDTLIAEGPVGWGITPFEGNYYISSKYLATNAFRTNFLPGICIYKFLYVWLDFLPDDGHKIKNLGWKYVLPNPLFPFIWFRVAVSGRHPAIEVKEFDNAP